MLIQDKIRKLSVSSCFFLILFIHFTVFAQINTNHTNKIGSVQNSNHATTIIDSSRENMALRSEIAKLKQENSNLKEEILNLQKKRNEYAFSCCDCPKSQCSVAIFVALFTERNNISY